ncbi:hypothetical protein G7Z17_g8079 [Cylindrodendrum hubeiense]|uniref:Uncharacterized protein n=1 Tax=Cylindrodendrum hubeiense TaxID=595255 RepID=A0A9P5HBW0_9HYPO|nr:hypothetical protein G7Z17_g8079 [Cylindrodendrum hubeiense]
MVRHLFLPFFLSSGLSWLGVVASPCRAPKPSYCSLEEWKKDPLLVSMTEARSHAQAVCTAAFQPANFGGDGHAITKVVQELWPDSTKLETLCYPTATITSYDLNAVIIKVVYGGETTILDPDTVFRTVGTTTQTFPTSTNTIDTTEVYYAGATTTKTITVASTTETHYEYTHTDFFNTATSVDVVANAVSTSIDVRITGTNVHTVFVNAAMRFLPVETARADGIKTFFQKFPDATRTHVVFTATEDVFPIGTTVVVSEPTGTTLLTKTTTTKTAYQTIGTKFVTTATRTDNTIIATATLTTRDIFTQTKLTTVSTKTKTTTSFIAKTFPENDRRALATAAIAPTGAPDVEQGLHCAWANKYGEEHIMSVCSCAFKPARARRTARDAPIVTETQTEKIYGRTITRTFPFEKTTTLRETATQNIIAREEGALAKRTVTVDILVTIQVTPIAERIVTHVSTNRDAKVATEEVTFTDDKTISGTTTVYGVLDLTQTSDYVAVQTRNTAVDETKIIIQTPSSTVDETVYDILTRTTPVAVTDVKKFLFTKTIFTDETTTYDVEATSTVGVITTRTEYTILTIKDGPTTTTTTKAVIQTVTAYVEATQTCRMPILNGGFESDDDDSWFLSGSDEVGGAFVSPGHNSNSMFMSDNMNNYNLLELFQDMRTCGNVKFTCDYDWYFSNYYATPYTYQNADGVFVTIIYVPYIRFFFNEEQISNRFPTDGDGSNVAGSADLLAALGLAAAAAAGSGASAGGGSRGSGLGGGRDDDGGNGLAGGLNGGSRGDSSSS